MKFGHYTTYKLDDAGCWWIFDDDVEVVERALPHAIFNTAYMLFYELVEVPALPFHTLSPSTTPSPRHKTYPLTFNNTLAPALRANP